MTSFTTKFIDGSARLELNLPDEPVNKISRAVRQELESVLDSIASASDIRAVKKALSFSRRALMVPINPIPRTAPSATFFLEFILTFSLSPLRKVTHPIQEHS